ncbi:kinesin-like protein NACK1 [Gossypium australe]|uniref:Kinesin-like protein NACK1 n=1 Tax=Gossypium australe TaxID=47621 RepID=A0A5B6WLZ6_9ROSI|nr:kinesin-like protein NACK1 [Gossypium australe]
MWIFNFVLYCSSIEVEEYAWRLSICWCPLGELILTLKNKIDYGCERMGQGLIFSLAATTN